jgi:hypothetical protein
MKYLFKLILMITCLSGVATWQSGPAFNFGTFGDTAFAAENKDDNTYDQDSVLKDAAEFFGKGTEGLAKVIEKAFKDHGRPNAYIKGEEASGALVVGLRYGDGTWVSKGGESRKVYWSGPSIALTTVAMHPRFSCWSITSATASCCSSVTQRWTAASTSLVVWASTTSSATKSSSRR